LTTLGVNIRFNRIHDGETVIKQLIAGADVVQVVYQPVYERAELFKGDD